MKAHQVLKRGLTRMSRSVGLNRNPLRRASDRAEAWIRVGLVAFFLVAASVAGPRIAHWAYHHTITVARTAVVPPRTGTPGVWSLQPGAARADRDGDAQAPGTRRNNAGFDARISATMAAVMALDVMVLALVGALRLSRAHLDRRRLN